MKKAVMLILSFAVVIAVIAVVSVMRSFVMTIPVEDTATAAAEITGQGSAYSDTGAAAPDPEEELFTNSALPAESSDLKSRTESSDENAASETNDDTSCIVIPVDRHAYAKVQDIISGKAKKTSCELDVEQLYQYPDLPTGCESVALTMALNYFGADLYLTEVAEKYLVYGDDIVTSFLGDPFEDGGAGIFPPGVVLTAQNYIDSSGDSLAPIAPPALSCKSCSDWSKTAVQS